MILRMTRVQVRLNIYQYLTSIVNISIKYDVVLFLDLIHHPVLASFSKIIQHTDLMDALKVIKI